MGPNTVTGHLSVIYTVECQINFTLRLLTPILQSLPSYRSKSLLPTIISPSPATIEVLPEAAEADSLWTQREAKKLVWASGCSNWAVDAKTGMNNMMYPDWQFLYWWRSIWWRRQDFVYRDEETGAEVRPGEVGRWVKRILTAAAIVGMVMKKDLVLKELPRRLRGLDVRGLVRSLSG
jgi:hypothetical protein